MMQNVHGLAQSTAGIGHEEGLTLSWRDVMNYKHTQWGWQGTFAEAAKRAGYPYYCWNDRVYSTTTGVYTGLNAEDVE